MFLKLLLGQLNLLYMVTGVSFEMEQQLVHFHPRTLLNPGVLGSSVSSLPPLESSCRVSVF